MDNLSRSSSCTWYRLIRPWSTYQQCPTEAVGRYSAVAIATALRAGRSGDRIPVRVRFSARVKTGPRAHPASYTIGTGSFAGVKRPGRGVDHPPTRGWRESRGIPVLPLWAFVACSRVTFTFTFTLDEEWTGPSWPVLVWPLPLPLPLTKNGQGLRGLF